MHRRRGGETRKRGTGHRGVTPASCRYPSLAAGFRRRALFFEKPLIAKSERHRLLRSFRSRPLGSSYDPGPYVSGTMGTGERNNHAYGISCRTRPISTVGSRSDCFETGTAWAVSRIDRPNQVVTNVTIRSTTNDAIDDGLGLKSGLTLGRLTADRNSFRTARRPI
jgi:hypothetical protein